MIKLSEDIKKWRAGRPDEWIMDRFIEEAERLEKELADAKPFFMLPLTKKQARWLKDVTLNHIGCRYECDEPKDNKKMRKEVYAKLPDWEILDT